ncbi:MAG: hypothetical protein ACR2PY_08225 [Salinispira sp.]
MKNLKKFLISLITGIIITTVFFIFGQTGLFRKIEATFYDSQVLRQKDDKLDQVYTVFVEYQSEIIGNAQELLYSPAFRRAFAVNQIAADIASRQDQITAFSRTYPAFVSLRFFDEDFLQLHYSSRISDIESRVSGGINYFPVENLSLIPDPADNIDTSELQNVGEWQRIVLEEPQILVYFFPLYDDFDIFAGWGMLEIDLSSLNSIFLKQQLILYGENIYVFSPEGIFLNGAEYPNDLFSLLRAQWPAFRNNEDVVLNVDSRGDVLVRIRDGEDIDLVYLIPLSELTLTPFMGVFLILVIFFTSFLVLFLIFNLRQDSEVIVRDRIKQFQLDLLRQAVDKQGKIDINLWQSELRLRKDVLRNKIVKGIPSRDKKFYDSFIDKSWNDILDILGDRQPSHQTTGAAAVNFDAAHLEQLVENLAARLEHGSVPAPAPSVSPAVLAAEEVEAAEDIEEIVEVESTEPETAGEDISLDVQDMTPLMFSQSSLFSKTYPLFDYASALVTLHAASPSAGAATDAAAAPTSDTVEELVEPTELQSVEEPQANIPPQTISVADLYDFLKDQVIRDKEGSPYISDTIFQQSIRQKNDEMGNLVDQVLHGSQEFSDEQGMNFDTILSERRDENDIVENRIYYNSAESDFLIIFTEAGIDLSSCGVRNGHKVDDILRVLMKLSIKLNAQNVLLSDVTGDTVKYISSIGFTVLGTEEYDSTDIQQIVSASRESLVTYFGSDAIAEKFPLFNSLSSRICAVLFIPCLHEDRKAMLVFGIPEPISDLKHYLSGKFTT